MAEREKSMATLSEALAIATEHHRAGRLQTAEQLYRQILAAEPNQPEALHLLGVIAQQAGKHALAIQYIERAIAIRGDQPLFHNNLGEAYRAVRRFPDAIACYRRALELNPDFAGAYYNLGNAWKGQGQSAEAIHCYRQAIERKPDYAEAYNNLGSALKEDGQIAESVACFQRALELKPELAEARQNLSTTLPGPGATARAEADDRSAPRSPRDDAEARFRLGNALNAQRRWADAAACYRRAVALKPDYVEAHNNLGATLKDQGKFAEAAVCYRTALRYQPDYAEAHNNLGGVFWELGNLDQALPCFRRALELKPDYAEAHYNLGVLLKDCGQAVEAVACYQRALELQPAFRTCHSNLVYLLHFCPGYDAQAIYEEHRRWNQRHAAALAKSAPPHGNERSPERRLRVGYVSPNFRVHCQSLFTVPLFSSHDHRNLEIFCYSDVDRPDDVTARLRSHADAWRDISGRSDEQVAELVRSDRIDILVDLTMHMEGNRLLVFARKPAPVQLCWLAYPATTGLTAIDYRLTDPHLDPPGCDDGCYAEESIRLGHSFWCYGPPESGPAVNRLPALDEGYVTFGCLNNFCKINPPVLKLWAQVLNAVDRSRLMILAPKGGHRQRSLDLLAQEGVAAERVTFVGGRPRPQYLELYRQIDLGLDTFPYNGHTTSMDSFWMGVPVVTLAGQTTVGRAGVSLSMNLDLPELIARDGEQFVRIAAELAGDLPRLAHLRATLRERMQRSPLMDAPRFAANVEAAYRAMWRRWCARR
jgi:predicted O-linked N-acetylglucosamine transferase (SPINDLY family)